MMFTLQRETFLVTEKEERWRELCAQAAVEQDSQKLMALVQEISRLLAQKQSRGTALAESDDKDNPTKQIEG
jgi:hypothetical protein